MMCPNPPKREPTCPYCKTATRYGEACRACSVPGGRADQHLKELRERKAKRE